MASETNQLQLPGNDARPLQRSGCVCACGAVLQLRLHSYLAFKQDCHADERSQLGSLSETPELPSCSCVAAAGAAQATLLHSAVPALKSQQDQGDFAASCYRPQALTDAMVCLLRAFMTWTMSPEAECMRVMTSDSACLRHTDLLCRPVIV